MNKFCCLNYDTSRYTLCLFWSVNIKNLTSFLRAPHPKTAAISPQIFELPMHCLIKWLNPHLSLLYNSALPIITRPEFQFCNLSNRKHINKDFVLHFKGLICILNRPLKPPSGQRLIYFYFYFNYCFSWSFIRSIRSSHYLWIINCDLYHIHKGEGGGG